MHNLLYILALIAFGAAVASAILGMQCEAITGLFLSGVLAIFGLIVDKSENQD